MYGVNPKENLFAGSEENQLEHLADSLKELGKTRPRSHKHLHKQNKVTVLQFWQTLLKIVFLPIVSDLFGFHLVLLVLEHNRKGEVGIVELLEGAVDQGLVQVEHQGELRARPGLEGQRRMPAAHLRGQRWQVLDEEVRVKLLPMFGLRLRLRGVDLHLSIELLIIIQMRLRIKGRFT